MTFKLLTELKTHPPLRTMLISSQLALQALLRQRSVQMGLQLENANRGKPSNQFIVELLHPQQMK